MNIREKNGQRIGKKDEKPVKRNEGNSSLHHTDIEKGWDIK